MLVLVATYSSTFFQFLPKFFSASKNLTCSIIDHLPFFLPSPALLDAILSFLAFLSLARDVGFLRFELNPLALALGLVVELGNYIKLDAD